MRILAIGDVIGNPGRNILKAFLDKNKSSYDFIIVNGENAAGGFGITPKLCDEILSWGVDVITSGNHIWDKRDIYDYLDRSNNVLRPHNYPEGVPGVGHTILKSRKGSKVAVISLQGRIFMPPIDCPFTTVNKLVEEIRKECKYIIVDFHAEATSEKLALGNFLDGKVSVVYGTHTHIQTADNRILPDGTGFICDIGMTGSDSGIIGMKKDIIISKFLTALPQKFDISEGNERINGIDIELDDETGECIKIKRINLSLNELGIF